MVVYKCYIFQDSFDTNCLFQYAQDIEQRLKELNKTNLTVNIFENHGYDLNYIIYLLKKEITLWIKSIFDTVEIIVNVDHISVFT